MVENSTPFAAEGDSFAMDRSCCLSSVQFGVSSETIDKPHELPVSDQSTISTWLRRLQGQPDDLSAQKIWDRVSPRIIVLSRRLIQKIDTDAAVDEEDVTLSVFATLYDGLQGQQFPLLQDSEGLLKLLVLMTVRKINDHSKFRRALKRNRGPQQKTLSTELMNERADDQPDPAEEAMMADQCRAMLEQLNDPLLESIVLLKLDGYTNDDIAEQLQYSRRTIQRMLNMVKEAWSCYLEE
jgi:DNA-directed RNA polymerase specialized sigma24 family protein